MNKKKITKQNEKQKKKENKKKERKSMIRFSCWLKVNSVALKI